MLLLRIYLLSSAVLAAGPGPMARVGGRHHARQPAPVILRIQEGDLLFRPRERVTDEELQTPGEPLVQLQPEDLRRILTAKLEDLRMAKSGVLRAILGEPLLAHRTEIWRMPEPRHPYADDAQDRHRSDEHADDDEQHACRGSTCPTTCHGSVLVLPFSVCAVVHTQRCSPAGEPAHQTREAVRSSRWGAVQCDTDTGCQSVTVSNLQYEENS